MLYVNQFFKYFGENKKSFVKYSFLSFIAGIMELFGVALTYPFVLKLLSKENNKTSVVIGLSIVLLFIAKNLFMIFYTYLQSKISKDIEAEVNLAFMKYFICAPYKQTSKIPFEKKSNILNFLIPNVINNFILRLLNLSVNFFIFVLITGFLAVKFPLATSVTFVYAIFIFTVQNKFFTPQIRNMSRQISNASVKYAQRTNEALLNLKNVKISNNESFFYQSYSSAIHDFYKLNRGTSFYNAVPPYITEPFIIILLFILLAIISLQSFAEPEKLVASFAVIVSAVFRLAPAISRIQVNINGIISVLPLAKELLGEYEKLEVKNTPEPEIKDFCNFQSVIELKNVYFSYEPENFVLKNINLTIKKGEFIGIAGLSGSGKTTLADIISGLNKPVSGELLIDGKPFEKPLKIGYIPQEYCVLNASIRENVTFGSPEIDDEAVKEALKKACLYDFIEDNFKDGIYANPFANSGLSQGQKQRLAIARALYSNPDIIILDEATSSLDLKTEDEICTVLCTLKGDKTIITIAHRLSTIKPADRIIFLKNCVIAGNAPFEQLAESNPDFNRLVQLASFKES